MPSEQHGQMNSKHSDNIESRIRKRIEHRVAKSSIECMKRSG
jgi:hypothetical protein